MTARKQYPPPFLPSFVSSSSRRLASTTASSSSNNDDEPSQEDTIFALSSGYTGQQVTALAVLRISGPQAHTVLDTLTKNNTKLPPARTAALRKLYYQDTMLDHALVLLFQQPRSFTGEDLVELHCHGSRAVVQGLLDVLPKLGCRMAEPGEFTQRAFGNGKLDLVQVEALADILGADTQSQLQQALSQLDGKLSQVYEDWRLQLISGLAHAEAVIDFGDDERLGEDDILDDDSEQWNVWGNVRDRMHELRTSMGLHLRDERKGELVREGVKIAIVGPPNAGKSSLFNLLAQRDAAIVSPIAGTTRDVLQVSMDLGGVKCTLQDTAGVRSEGETSDSLELEGIKRAQSVAEQADLVVAMVDATEASRGIDIVQGVLEEKEKLLKSEHILLVLNKLDLVDTTTTKAAASPSSSSDGLLQFGGTHEISCITQEGIDGFLDALTKSVVSRTTQRDDDGGEGALITRARHRQHVEASSEALERFEILSTQGTMAVDMAAEELRLAASELGRITGAVDVEDVLDVLFNDFCIGK
jgi:tRNA modification GTPase